MYDRKLWRFWLRRSALVLGAVVMSMMTWHTASAQLDTEHKTVVTFSVPTEVPGSNPQVLPAGSYMFKVLDSQSNRNIVQVSNKEETHVYTTILAIPTYREEDTDKTVMTFEERAAGQPQALRAWYYPHERSGQEFVYSKERATQLAKSSNTRVPYSESASIATSSSNAQSQSVTNTNSSPIMTVTPTGQSAPYTQQAQDTARPPVAAQPVAAQPAQSNTPAPAEAPVQARQQSTQPVQTASNLPRTASDVPWVAMIGCLLLIAGISIRKLCER